MIWLLTSLALADPCPDPAAQLQSATLAFEDAEVQQAEAHLEQAMAGLSCTTEPLDNAALQDLFGFAAVVAYAGGDEAKARAALRRLQTVSLEPTPHPYFGPELLEMFEQTGDMLPAGPVELTISDGWQRAWVDGQLLSGGDSVALRPGSHLVNAPTGAAWFGEWVAVNEDGVFSPPGQVTAVPTTVAGVDVGEAPDTGALVEDSARSTPSRRRHRTGLLVAGALTAAAGGGALVYGWQSENQFNIDPYNAATYDGCAVADGCYADARVKAIQSDASRIRVAYLAGYALTAVGVGLVGAELFILPAPRGASGGQLGLRGAF